MIEVGELQGGKGMAYPSSADGQTATQHAHPQSAPEARHRARLRVLPFLLDVLRHLGFGTRWRKWVSILLSTASTRVLVNGAAGPPIRHAKGLR